jgi:glycosyltransferase involved in cell wall biosynthesis
VDTPLVSIVIPVYNGANYMRTAIDSALAQTYKAVEVVIVNDGSTDETETIARSYGDRVRYFSKSNGGQSTALNLGIEMMEGEYFSWLSHDDVYYPEKIERAIDAIKAEPHREDVFIFSDYELIDSNGAGLGIVDNSHIRPSGLVFQILLQNSINACTLLIRKSHLREIGGFNVYRPHTSDIELISRLAMRFRAVHIPEVLVQSRMHELQVTHTGSNRHAIESDMFGVDILDILDRNALLRSAETVGVSKPLYELARKWSRRGTPRAFRKAARLSAHRELSFVDGFFVKAYCEFRYRYFSLRRMAIRLLRAPVNR